MQIYIINTSFASFSGLALPCSYQEIPILKYRGQATKGTGSFRVGLLQFRKLEIAPQVFSSYQSVRCRVGKK